MTEIGPTWNANDLTERQYQVLAVIVAYIASHVYSPSLDDIAHRLSLSKTTVLHHVEELEEAGYIKRTPGQARSIVVLKSSS